MNENNNNEKNVCVCVVSLSVCGRFEKLNELIPKTQEKEQAVFVWQDI